NNTTVAPKRPFFSSPLPEKPQKRLPFFLFWGPADGPRGRVINLPIVFPKEVPFDETHRDSCCRDHLRPPPKRGNHFRRGYPGLRPAATRWRIADIRFPVQDRRQAQTDDVGETSGAKTGRGAQDRSKTICERATR